MKTILVDAVFCFVDEQGSIDQELYALLEKFPNKKIILTGANDEQFKMFGLDRMPYEVFTLKHNPEKSDSEYYKILLERFGLDAKDVAYFEHSKEAVKSARSVGIETHWYNFEEKDPDRIKRFLEKNI